MDKQNNKLQFISVYNYEAGENGAMSTKNLIMELDEAIKLRDAVYAIYKDAHEINDKVMAIEILDFEDMTYDFESAMKSFIKD